METDIDNTKPQRTEFALVVFHNIPDTYPSDAHIECKYTITPELVPTGRDWVGLFKVGWMSTGDYHYYEWAPTPKDYEIGKEADNGILFPAHKMPGDDGEFYQFCYVTSTGHIRGASTPFQFKKPSADDFLEIEDPETDMLMIRSKGIVLEERLKSLEDEREELLQKQVDLEKEREGLVEKLCELDKHLKQAQEENQALENRVKASENYISQLNHEAHDMNIVREELQTRCDSSKQELQELDGRMSRLSEEIKELKSQIRKLQNEKDTLDGENKNLLGQIDMYKNQFMTSESSKKDQLEELHTRIAEQESLVSHLRKQVDTLTKQLEAQHTTIAKDKDCIDHLTEQLKNTEDKLEAAEKTKKMMQAEMNSYEEIKQKMSKDLERSEGECDALKRQLKSIEETLTEETQLLKAEINTVKVDLQQAVKEKEKVAMEKSELSEKLEKNSEHSESSLSSLHCLQMAQKSLKERYSKMEQNNQELHTETTKRLREYKHNIKELVRENEDLKERLNMGSNEYRTLYIENKKLQKKIEKMEKHTKSTSSERKMSESSISSQTYLVEVPQKSPASVFSDVTEGNVSTKLEQELEDMGQELQTRQEKKARYKKMYKDEKDKVEALRKHYHEETRRKDEEIDRLRKGIEIATSENDIKIRSLEKFVNDKQQLITSLERKLRESTHLHDRPGAAAATEHKGEKDAPYQYPFVMYPKQMYVASPMVYPHPGQYYTPPTYPGTAVKLTNPPLEPLKYPELPKKEDQNDETPLLQPLPPPMEPERLPSSLSMDKKHTFEDFLDDLEPDVAGILPSAPPANQCDMKEERFEDAIGEAMKICPVCNDSFSADIDAKNFEMHVLSHIGHICPICQNLIEDVTEQEFQYHVNKHLDQQKQAEGDDNNIF